MSLLVEALASPPVLGSGLWALGLGCPQARGSGLWALGLGLPQARGSVDRRLDDVIRTDVLEARQAAKGGRFH